MTGNLMRYALRALLCALVLSGLVAMHQLAMPPHERPAAPVAAVEHTKGQADLGCCDQDGSPLHTSLHLCLAILVAGAALFGLLRGAAVPLNGGCARPSGPLAVRTGARLPPWAVPTLHSLQVLRL